MSVRLAYFDAVTDIEAEYYELRWSIWQNRFHSASTMRMLYARNSFPTHIGISPAQHGNGERQSFSIGKSGMYMHTK